MLGNQNQGYSWHASAALQKRFRQGFLKGAYSYGESKSMIDPGSIAVGLVDQQPDRRAIPTTPRSATRARSPATGCS